MEQYTEQDRHLVHESINDSEDLFEKNIIYLSAGSLGVSFSFIEKIVVLVDAQFKFLLYSAWACMVLALCLNLLSHLLSVRNGWLAREAMDNNIEYDILNKSMRLRNRNVMRLNWISVTSLIFGIALLFIFISINI